MPLPAMLTGKVSETVGKAPGRDHRHDSRYRRQKDKRNQQSQADRLPGRAGALRNEVMDSSARSTGHG